MGGDAAFRMIGYTFEATYAIVASVAITRYLRALH